MLEKQKQKSAYVERIHGLAHTEAMTVLLEALDYFIQEVRELNDVCSKDELSINQGEIQAYKNLKRHIQEGVPRHRFENQEKRVDRGR